MPNSTSSNKSLNASLLDQTALRMERARRNLLKFVGTLKPDYKPDAFHGELCRLVERFHADVEAKRRPRVIVCAPPQHGKSEIVSRKYPAWALGKNPELRVIAGSYSGAWAEALGADVQRTIDSAEYHAIFPRTRIVGQFAQKGEAKRASDYFEIVGHQGFHRAAGRGVGVAGRPADILLIDDPMKNAEEAFSEGTRESVWNWYLQDLYTRLQQGAGVFVMATRWHTDDLIGRLIDAQGSGGDQWDVHIFPALDESGQALAPSRFDAQELQRIKATQPALVWSALYQGEPAPLSGNIFQVDRWRYFGGPGQPAFPKDFDLIVQSWDASFKDSAGSDFCAGQTWGLRGAERWLFPNGYVLAKMDYPAFKNAVKEQAAQHPRASFRLIEDKANGSAVVAELRTQVTGLTPIEPEGGKISRAWAASADQSAGNCWLPDPSIAPWVSDFVRRCALFPANINKPGSDDDLDSFTQLINWARQQVAQGIYRHALAGTLYDDSQRPAYLDRRHFCEQWLALNLSPDSLLGAFCYDDGGVTWCDREFFADSRPGAWKSEGEFAADLVQWLGDDPREWPMIILDPQNEGFATRLRAAGTWVVESEVDPEQDARKIAALLSAGRIRVHERCVNVRRALTALTWPDLRTSEGKRMPDPLRLVASRIPSWRLT